jgi:hypothetical protein
VAGRYADTIEGRYTLIRRLNAAVVEPETWTDIAGRVQLVANGYTCKVRPGGLGKWTASFSWMLSASPTINPSQGRSWARICTYPVRISIAEAEKLNAQTFQIELRRRVEVAWAAVACETALREEVWVCAD